MGSFLFLGPTGVGKTELTQALAEFLFDGERDGAHRRRPKSGCDNLDGADESADAAFPVNSRFG